MADNIANIPSSVADSTPQATLGSAYTAASGSLTFAAASKPSYWPTAPYRVTVFDSASGDITFRISVDSGWPTVTAAVVEGSDHNIASGASAEHLGPLTAGGFDDRVNVVIAADATKQAADSDLTAIAGLSPANDDVIQRKSGAWTNRTMAQLIADLAALGTTFQPLDSDLTAIAALTTTAYGRALLELANAAAFTALGNAFTGDSGAGGVKGLVPAPAAGDAAANKFLRASGVWAVAGAGDVAGPASATDNAVVRFDATTGKLVQNSAFLVDDTGHVTAFGGNLKFPATDAASADANTLDDYEEGTWTPALTFATLGNLSVTYSGQTGTYLKIGKTVIIWFNLTTSAFTHTTASGNCEVTGVPFTSGLGFAGRGALSWQGITKASYTDMCPSVVTATTLMRLAGMGSGQAVVNITAADMPTGGTVAFTGNAIYTV